ncbi:DOmon domain containing protein [Nitzschia inconspicua]|uniref:DOmon domain containing protein n=1 Tax=Nitzschia inconspicua TaxID=303405 RepID=A0A9K3K972_9STRA|nr:DOmon domain containing protein [Nitzschia inconspicua]KAG7359499.1 DOmon domain containing protein [Nitzschia inconspicua]
MVISTAFLLSLALCLLQTCKAALYEGRQLPAVAADCSTVVDLLGDSRLILTQTVVENDENELLIEILLTYADQAWLSIGYNRNGRMVGSTVVIGFPDKPLVEGKNPGSYFLGNKNIKFIRPADEVKSKPETRPDDDWFVWRRELYDPHEATERMLAISDTSLMQNDTHTLLRFTRPFVIDDDNNDTKVHPDDLNTLIFAVGGGNQFGYHSGRGSKSIQFSNSCPHGIIPSSPENDTETFLESYPVTVEATVKVQSQDQEDHTTAAPLLSTSSQSVENSAALQYKATLLTVSTVASSCILYWIVR